ncbi:alpha/beta fold hydrolase [Shewanella sp. FJAT-52076]|uniref:alpha/beta fold hydrolase n=1 Tax=Shewanella sp. FJAT-52076 TaxID=2864202 RepID=UPI001C65CA1C|nr:alpha/beta fold hydrolase [Shewanella sp. FJAT-52076]
MHTPALNTSLTITPALMALYQRCELGSLSTSPGVDIAWLALEHPSPKGSIVFSNGRVEAFLKYLELYQAFYDAGYSVYALDHRGQGLSSRLTPNRHMGHVAHFSDYIADFHGFMEQVVRPRAKAPLFLAGHSMGGAIGTLYLQAHPGVFSAACFSAPMYGICLPMNKVFVRWLAQKLDASAKGLPNYILGGKDYNPAPFAKNDLTKSEARYQAYRELYQQNPQLQLGSPTNRWLLEALDACDEAVLAARESKIPLLVLQASEDTIVDNKAQNRALGGLCECLQISDARHEILMECDGPRTKAIEAMLGFFASHAKHR